MATRKKTKKSRSKSKKKRTAARKSASRKKVTKKKKKAAKKAKARRPKARVKAKKKKSKARAKPKAKPKAKAKKKPKAKKKAKAKAKRPSKPKARATLKVVITKPAPAAPVAPPGTVRVGMVTHYYSHLSVAVIKLDAGSLREGDTVHIKGHTSDFRQRVDSMEVDHVHVPEVRPGESFGLRVKEHAREHDVVYKVLQ